MNHTELMSCLEEVVPQIRTTQNPDGVIVKFARDNNLSPAQVEKVCQSVNILKTLNFMEKSANRGGTFSIVNPESILSEYMKPGEITKEPELQKAASTVDPEDINSWIDSPSKESYERIPNLFEEVNGTSDDYSVKLASKIESMHKEANDYWRSHFDVKDTGEALGQIRDDWESKARDIFEKIADHIRSHPDITFADVEEDAMRLFDGSVKKACDTASNYLSQCNVVHERVPETAFTIDKLARDRTGIASLMQEAQDALEMIENTVEFSKQAVAAAATSTSSSSKKKKKDKGERYQPPSDMTPVFSDVPEAEVGDPGKSESLPTESAIENILALMSPGDMKTKAVDKILGKNIARESKAYKKDLKKKEESALESAQQQSALQKLMLTDPIISEADPKMVKEIYETILNNAPDLAKDPGLLRFSIREAIQYEGIPPTSLKDLISMQESKSKIRSLDARAEKDEEEDM